MYSLVMLYPMMRTRMCVLSRMGRMLMRMMELMTMFVITTAAMTKAVPAIERMTVGDNENGGCSDDCFAHSTGWFQLLPVESSVFVMKATSAMALFYECMAGCNIG